MQDPNPLPWGAQDKFQIHFIVKQKIKHSLDYVAKTKLTTKGHFGSKKLVNIKWTGGKLADVLNQDSKLHDLILEQPIENANIFIDPVDDVVRMYGSWKNKNLVLTKDLFNIYDAIALHIKSI
ncbi:MAG: hypothetical protein OXF28_00085 [Thaumarchaeota archaeon]|nr:hypothetical protein [Nitrososphaerota archaeon]MCY3975522.1 hypothetical protein [Nitrososphaerota archaeon]